jgi:hypothetical protein
MPQDDRKIHQQKRDYERYGVCAMKLPRRANLTEKNCFFKELTFSNTQLGLMKIPQENLSSQYMFI